jgi:group I intron endonuclease
MPASDPTTSRRSGIYRIRHLVSGKVYVGSAKNIRSRWHHHRSDLALKKHHCISLQRAWDKSGCAAFVFEVVEYVDDLGQLITREQFHIDQQRATDPRRGYNLSPTAGSRLGTVHSEATRAKLSASLAGRVLSEKHRANISAGSKGKKKPNRTAEHRARMSAAFRCRKWTQEAIAKRSATRTGRHLSEETKAKISASHKGKTISPEAIAKTVAKRRGQSISPEGRARMAAAQQARRAKEKEEAVAG